MATSVRSREALPVISGTDVNNILAKKTRAARRKRRRQTKVGPGLICVAAAQARDKRGEDSRG